MLYFFDCRDGDLFVRDTEGSEVSSREAAQGLAEQVLVKRAKDVIHGSTRRELSIDVRDEEGHDILRASLLFEVLTLD